MCHYPPGSLTYICNVGYSISWWPVVGRCPLAQLLAQFALRASAADRLRHEMPPNDGNTKDLMLSDAEHEDFERD